MKSMIRIVVATVAIASSFSVFAQSNAPVTRAQVKSQLVQLERAGYNPAANDANYPQQLNAAQARLSGSEGGVAAGSSASGSHVVRVAEPVAPMSGVNSVYFGQ